MARERRVSVHASVPVNAAAACVHLGPWVFFSEEGYQKNQTP